MSKSFEIKIQRHPLTRVARRLPFADDRVKLLTQIGQFRAGQSLIFVAREALQRMEDHTAQHAKHGEVGGLMFGTFGIAGDVPFTWIEVALAAELAVSGRGSLRFTNEAIHEIDRRRELLYPDLRSVGWYHSHPGFGVFLSGTDLNTHRTMFRNAPYVATVLDPIHETNGFFTWLDEEVAGPLAYWIADLK